jgi:hypothetical protein
VLLRALRDPRRGGPSPLARGLAVLVVAGMLVASGAIVLVPLLRWVVETLL